MRVSEKFYKDECFFPIGMNNRVAVGLCYTKLGFKGFRTLAINMEINQFAQNWRDVLLRTTTIEQYNEVNESMLSFVSQGDNVLKVAAKLVFQDTDILTHRKNLPAESKINAPPITEFEKIDVDDPILKQVSESIESEHHIRVVTNHYNNKKKNTSWKESKITLPCSFEGQTFPFCYLCGDTLVSSLLLHRPTGDGEEEKKKIIQIDYFARFDTHPKDRLIFQLDDQCENTPIVTTDTKWIALVNMYDVVVFRINDMKTFKFKFINIPTAIKLKNDQLCVGTLTGEYYRIDIQSGLCLFSERLPEQIAILDVQYVGCRIAIQTMSDARYLEESHNTMVNVDRPLSISLFEDTLIIFNKYGYTRIIREKDELLLKAPDVVFCDLINITPWYQNAIVTEKDKALHILMPNGMIVNYPFWKKK